jgi:hypothetical protein
MANQKLRDVDTTLRSANRPTFEVTGVAGVGSPERRTKYVPTQRWKPVDTRIRVSDVAALVHKLGGKICMATTQTFHCGS